MGNYDPIDFIGEDATQGNRVNHGGPAFPRSAAEHSQGGHYEQDGMTLRDYFAIHATNQDIEGYRDADLADDGVVEYRRTTAQARYAFADAMIAAREGGAK